MNLLIISHTPHIDKDGVLYGWGPTVSELNFLSTKFSSITHIAPLTIANDSIPPSFLPVNSSIRIAAVRNRGGKSIMAKLKVLWDCLQYIFVVFREVKSFSGLIHVRCPSNISMIALFVLIFFSGKKKWIKYAGDWQPNNDYLSYKMQRFIIRYLLRNQVATINGYHPHERSSIHYFLNPSFKLEEVTAAADQVRSKRLDHEICRLLFVGSLEENKCAHIAIEVLNLLKNHCKCELVLVGSGSEEFYLRELVLNLDLGHIVQFTGWKNREEIKMYYKDAHFILLPSQGEGWPKVISEAMTYGVVPIVSDVSSIRYSLSNFKTGSVIYTADPKDYCQSILTYIHEPLRWYTESTNAINSSVNFSLEVWWEKLKNLFDTNLK